MSDPVIFKELHLRNFLSFGNSFTKIDLTPGGSTLIVGENIDASGANGAGKTVLINAITYALFNKPFDNIALQRLINGTQNSKNTLMEVRLVFCRGDDTYEIHRTRGEQFNIKVTMNDDDITLDSVAGNDSLIEQIIGISYDLFTKIVIFSGNSTPFLQMPVAQQRQQIEELFNITMLTEKAAKLKEVIRETDSSISIQSAVIKEQESQISLYEKQLAAAEQRVVKWQSDWEAQILSLRDNLDKMQNIDIALEKELHAIVDDTEKKLASLSNTVTLQKRDVSTLTSELKKLEVEIGHLADDTCPYCLQAFADAKDKLGKLHASTREKNEKLIAAKSQLATNEEEIAVLKSIISDARANMTFDSVDLLLKAERMAESAVQKIEDLTNSSNPHIEALEQLQSCARTEISYSKIDELKRDIEHQQFLLKLLTDKNSFIRRKIINRTVPFLNSRLNSYTKELGLPHVVKFDTDMSCAVSEYGRELDFGNLSSGEKKRVNLALSLAFRDVLHHLHSRINCLFIDEIDASLDGAGVDNVFRLLKNKARDDRLGLWIISHRPEAVSRFDRTLTVRKENGFSRIVEEEYD